MQSKDKYMPYKTGAIGTKVTEVLMEKCDKKEFDYLLNCGFTEVVDFVEPGFDSSSEEVQKMQQKIEERQSGFEKEPAFTDERSALVKVVTNNFIALVVHCIVLMLVSALVMIFGWIGLLGAVGGGFVAHVFAGYKFLSPISRYNFFSVLCLVVFPGLFFGPLYIVGLFPTVDASLAFYAEWINPSAIFAAEVLSEGTDSALFLLGYDSATFEHESSILSTVAFVAAFTPALLMYSGLCVKIWQQKRKQS